MDPVTTGILVNAGGQLLGGLLGGEEEAPEDLTGHQNSGHRRLHQRMIQDLKNREQRYNLAQMAQQDIQRQALGQAQAQMAAGAPFGLSQALLSRAGSQAAQRAAQMSAQQEAQRQQALISAIAQQGALDLRTVDEQAAQQLKEKREEELKKKQEEKFAVGMWGRF